MGLRKELRPVYTADIAAALHKNFSDGSIVLYLSYDNAPDYKEAADRLHSFIASVRRLWTKKTGRPGRELHYCAATQATASGQLHHHVILPGDVPAPDLESRWRRGAVQTKPLYGADSFPDIARHLTKHRTAYLKFSTSASFERLRWDEEI